MKETTKVVFMYTGQLHSSKKTLEAYVFPNAPAGGGTECCREASDAWLAVGIKSVLNGLMPQNYFRL